MNRTSIQRNTRQRRVILDELQKLTSHPTAATLYGIVRRRLPKVSLGTVYRNLELLARMGVIQKLDFAGGEARYDGNVARHDHLRCVRCGRVDDVSALALDLPEGQTHDWGGYQILGHRLEFFGVCPECVGAESESVRRDGERSMDIPAQRGAGLSESLGNNSSNIPNRDNAPVSRKPR